MAECDSRQTKVTASASFMQDACRSKGVRAIRLRRNFASAGLVATSLQVIVGPDYLPGSGNPDDSCRKMPQTPFERIQSGPRRL